MQVQSNNINKVRELLYAILKYSFNQYFEFGFVLPFCFWRENNMCAWVDSIQLGINGQYIPTHYFCDARLPFSPKRTFFRHLSLSLNGFRHFSNIPSPDLHLKHLQGVRSVRLLSESPAARAFYFSFLILLKHFSTEWLAPPQKAHFLWIRFAL